VRHKRVSQLTENALTPLVGLSALPTYSAVMRRGKPLKSALSIRKASPFLRRLNTHPLLMKSRSRMVRRQAT